MKDDHKEDPSANYDKRHVLKEDKKNNNTLGILSVQLSVMLVNALIVYTEKLLRGNLGGFTLGASSALESFL